MTLYGIVGSSNSTFRDPLNPRRLVVAVQRVMRSIDLVRDGRQQQQAKKFIYVRRFYKTQWPFCRYAADTFSGHLGLLN